MQAEVNRLGHIYELFQNEKASSQRSPKLPDRNPRAEHL